MENTGVCAVAKPSRPRVALLTAAEHQAAKSLAAECAGCINRLGSALSKEVSFSNIHEVSSFMQNVVLYVLWSIHLTSNKVTHRSHIAFDDSEVPSYYFPFP